MSTLISLFNLVHININRFDISIDAIHICIVIYLFTFTRVGIIFMSEYL